MTFDESYEYISTLNIAEKTELTFKAACIIYWCAVNKTWNQRKVRVATQEYNITHWEIGFIIDNLHKNDFIDQYTYLKTESGELNIIELTLISAVGAGKIKTNKCKEPLEFKKVLDLTGFYEKIKHGKKEAIPDITDEEAEIIKAKQNKPYEFNTVFFD